MNVCMCNTDICFFVCFSSFVTFAEPEGNAGCVCVAPTPLPSLCTFFEGAEALTQVMNELWGDGVEYQVSTASFPVRSRLSSQMIANVSKQCRYMQNEALSY